MPRRAEVDRWFRTYDNPMKEVVLAIRRVILGVDPRVDECIKWQAPAKKAAGKKRAAKKVAAKAKGRR